MRTDHIAKAILENGKEIIVDEPFMDAVELLIETAKKAEISPVHLMEIFRDGIPECPHCEAEKAREAPPWD